MSRTEKSGLRSFSDTSREKGSEPPEKSSRKRKNSDCGERSCLTDYRSADLSVKDRLLYYSVSCACLFLLGLLFYRSAYAGLAACLASFPLERIYQSFAAEKRRETLLRGFKDALYTISGAVAAGRQMPSAIALAGKSAEQNGGASGDIAAELAYIAERYESTHADIGVLLEDLGCRSGVPEIKQFASAYAACQRCGGDLEEVCLKTAELLIGRISVRDEARALISQKKLDVLLLSIMPVAVLAGLNILGYSYLAVLYETAAGRVVMSLCLALIICAMLWGIRITKIDL